MWSQEGEEENPPHPLTLVSKAAPGSVVGAGDTEDCHPAVGSITQLAVNRRSSGSSLGPPSAASPPGLAGASPRPLPAGSAATATPTTALAANGDIYFFSPEQLDGDRGVLDQENLYLYRAAEDRVHFVATFAPDDYCQIGYPSLGEREACTTGPILRMQVTPDGSHMAFLTAQRLTSYDNAGHLEIYSYTPATGALVCDSCNPDGRPATADTLRQPGRPLPHRRRPHLLLHRRIPLPRDTNGGEDVYEFVDGAPHLITPGTGIAAAYDSSSYVNTLDAQPGLVGVSANGTDVYFFTEDTLTAEDRNGHFLKFYDARTNGGFPQPTPAQPCAAAEECHGPGTEAPSPFARGTVATLSGGNDSSSHRSSKHLKRHHKRKHRRHNRPAHRRAGR